ncbi:MAG: HyaD/HybD family hydrogenase maturation endopeptidase [Anaerolineales bacterium]|nr:HyaD/HybD family hydrogenase maturation endopeptidase [Anaerolineales bacterium]
MARALVLGVGNILEKDEGLGVRAVEWLQANVRFPANGQEVMLLDGGTSGLELLGYLEGVDHLIVLDAIDADKASGELIALEGDAVPAFLRFKVSPHQVGVHDLLVAAKLLGCAPPTIAVLGLQPESLGVGLELSPTIAARIELLARRALEQLRAWGYDCEVGPR